MSVTHRNSDGSTYRGKTKHYPDNPCDDCGCEHFDCPEWANWVACAECGKKH